MTKKTKTKIEPVKVVKEIKNNKVKKEGNMISSGSTGAAKIIYQELTEAKLGQVLVSESYLEKADVENGLRFSREGRGTLPDYLLTNGLLTKDLLGQAIAEFYHLKYADLNTNRPEDKQVKMITEDMAAAMRVVLYSLTEKEAIVTTDDPRLVDLTKIQPLFKNLKLSLRYSLTEDIDSILATYKKSLETEFSKVIINAQRIAPNIIEIIFEDAINQHASDVHFEPSGSKVKVRFRVDGVMFGAGEIPAQFYPNILNRVKVLSNMRIDEHFAAQDGAIRFTTKTGIHIDMRSSVIPTIEGEKIVIRLLSHYVSSFSLSDLGLSDTHKELIRQASEKPFGMILVVGPTGSGKTTTLYALLKLLNSPDVNITTIEDPVEYRIQGINQIQVNSQTNLTFAKGLRSIVRQDPDVILVGEIRDTETAEISVNAALTGHLLLSTFHANDAASAVPRLLDMNVEPFLIASTLQVLMAQRLVRKICDRCRASITMSKADLVKKFKVADQYFSLDKNVLYEGKGCEMCNHTGYHGRTAIYEFIDINPAMEDLIVRKPSSKEIWSLARSYGAKTMFEDGILKVKEGVTTLAELLRVAEPPEFV